jgi:hypothetical protein
LRAVRDLLGKEIIDPRITTLEEQLSALVDTGGAYIGGNVDTGGGDFVGWDKNVNVGGRSIHVGGSVSNSTLVTGDGNTINNTQNIFAPVYLAIQESKRTPAEKGDLTADVKEIEAQVVEGKLVDESFLGRRLRNLKRMAPDIAEVALATLAGPGAVVGMAVKKIAEKVKAEE